MNYNVVIELLFDEFLKENDAAFCDKMRELAVWRHNARLKSFKKYGTYVLPDSWDVSDFYEYYFKE